MKVILNPLAGVELKWRMMVMNEIPNAPPTVRNIPRSPVMVATFSGISSMQALLEAGIDNPDTDSSDHDQDCQNFSNSQMDTHHSQYLEPCPPRRIVEREMMLKPNTMGHR